MKLEEFDYPLPPALIAQYPSPSREASRLMVVSRENGTIGHRIFKEIGQYLNPGDLLVMNNTRVLPARLLGRKETGGRCEALLIPPWNGTGEWTALFKGIRNVRTKCRIFFENGIEGEVSACENGRGKIRFHSDREVFTLLRQAGHIPLPPYIKRADEPLDRVRYQTVYAEKDGSIAAPTAGLHFTEPMLRSLREKGVNNVSITLHVGPGTFKPVHSDTVEAHAMEPEWTEIPREVADAISQTKRNGGKVISVGTTTIRALESFSTPEGRINPGEGLASLFIHPPFRFQVIQGMITNFHLPKSTLLMLVGAFTGMDLLRKAYREAVEQKYRFYSYGDAMLIL